MTTDPRALWKIDAVGISACAAASVLAWFGIVRPHLGGRLAEVTRYAALADRNTETDALRREKASCARELDERRRLLEATGVELHPLDYINTHIERVTNVANDLHLLLDEVSPGKPEAGARFIRVPITLSGRGEFPAVTAFLARVHEAFPDTAVIGFRLTGHAGQPEIASTFSIDLTWHAASAGLADSAVSNLKKKLPTAGRPMTCIRYW